MNRSHLTEAQLKSDVMAYCEKEIEGYNQLKDGVSQVSEAYSGMGGIAGNVLSAASAGYSESRTNKNIYY